MTEFDIIVVICVEIDVTGKYRMQPSMTTIIIRSNGWCKWKCRESVFRMFVWMLVSM